MFLIWIKGIKNAPDITGRDVRVNIIIVSGLTRSPFSGQEVWLLSSLSSSIMSGLWIITGLFNQCGEGTYGGITIQTSNQWDQVLRLFMDLIKKDSVAEEDLVRIGIQSIV